MIIRFKKLNENAVIPTKAKLGDAGFDLVATELMCTLQSEYEYGTGLAVEIPDGYFGLLTPRSSVSKTCLRLLNGVGVIDSGYRGEIVLKFQVDIARQYNGNRKVYEVGDRVGQLLILPVPEVEFEEAIELSTSFRGEGGWGSTGQ